MPELKNVKVDFVSLVDRAAVRDPGAPTEPRRFLVWKSERGDNANEGGNMPQTETRSADELSAELSKAEQRIAKLEEDLEQASAPAEPAEAAEPATQEIDKSELSPAVRDALEKAEAETAKLRKQAEDAEKIAKEERDRRVVSEFISKAEALPHLSTTADKLGPVLKRASEQLSKEDYEALEGLLSTANEQISTGQLFSELGGSGDVHKSDAETEVLRKAQELREKDSSLSVAKAMDQVLDSDRALQARYLAAIR